MYLYDVRGDMDLGGTVESQDDYPGIYIQRYLAGSDGGGLVRGGA